MRTRYTTLREYLKRTGTTQAELAQRLGVKQPVISRIVNGRRRPSASLAFRLQDATGIPARSFIEQEAT